MSVGGRLGAVTSPGPAAPALTVRAYGAQGALVEVAESAGTRLRPGLPAAVAEHLRPHAPAREVVAGARTVVLDGLAVPLTAVEEMLADFRPGPGGADRAPVTIEVSYDGADLQRVAELWQVPVRTVVRRHLATAFVVAFGGFAPGFGYLSGLPEAWAVPRLGTPRSRVPAGSVALADRWCGIYPSPSPGGWLLIGRTSARLWDTDRQEPALLAPGAPVRFVEAV